MRKLNIWFKDHVLRGKSRKKISMNGTCLAEKLHVDKSNN